MSQLDESDKERYYYPPGEITEPLHKEKDEGGGRIRKGRRGKMIALEERGRDQVKENEREEKGKQSRRGGKWREEGLM